MAAKGDNINKSLLNLIKRVESVNGEIEALTEDRKEIFTEAKALGHDIKSMRKIIAYRKRERDKIQEEQENLMMMAEAVDPALANALRS